MADPQVFTVSGSEAYWEWEIEDDNVNELTIYDNTNSEEINGDGFDGGGLVYIDENAVNMGFVEADFTGGSATFS